MLCLISVFRAKFLPVLGPSGVLLLSWAAMNTYTHTSTYWILDFENGPRWEVVACYPISKHVWLGLNSTLRQVHSLEASNIPYLVPAAELRVQRRWIQAPWAHHGVSQSPSMARCSCVYTSTSAPAAEQGATQRNGIPISVADQRCEPAKKCAGH